MTLFFEKIQTQKDAELLRNIRNSCRVYMTRHTELISKEQQEKWFETSAHKYAAYIVYVMEHGAIVTYAGFGLIHLNDTESLLTGGFLEEYRNIGLGTDLFDFLLSTALERSLPVKLEVLKENIRALKVYEKLGFRTYEETEEIYRMEYNHDTII